MHCSSGLAAVAYAMVLGKRRDYDENVNTPHNVSFVFLGLALMWFGKIPVSLSLSPSTHTPIFFPL